MTDTLTDDTIGCALESDETPVPAIAEYRLIFRQPDGDMRDVVRPGQARRVQRAGGADVIHPARQRHVDSRTVVRHLKPHVPAPP